MEKPQFDPRLTDILEILPAGIIILNAQGYVQGCNAAAKELLGEPLVGELWAKIIERAFIPQQDDGHEISTYQGRRLQVAINTLSNEPGEIILLTDLTETRALQDRVSHQKRLSALGEMSAKLAHQLRTPLATALLYAGHLSHAHLTDQQQQRFANKLTDRLRELESIINDILLYARSGSAIVERITVSELMKQVDQGLAAIASQCQLRIVIADSCRDQQVTINRHAVVGAIQNIIVNAAQAVGLNGNVAVRVTNDEHNINFSVMDNGPGFPQTIINQVSEPFFTTKSNGTGLGLAVVKAVADAHGGEMVIENNPNGGATVSLKMPALHSELVSS